MDDPRWKAVDGYLVGLLLPVGGKGYDGFAIAIVG
jgi:hypothetical protein